MAKTKLKNNQLDPTITASLNTVIVDIGDWNMDSTDSVNVTHNLDVTKIRSITGTIHDDNQVLRYPIAEYANAGTPTHEVWIQQISSTVVTIRRLLSGAFDGSSNFNATSFNRGYLVIQYVD